MTTQKTVYSDTIKSLWNLPNPNDYVYPRTPARPAFVEVHTDELPPPRSERMAYIGVDFGNWKLPVKTLVTHQEKAIGMVTNWDVKRDNMPIYEMGRQGRYMDSYGKAEITATVSCNEEFMKTVSEAGNTILLKTKTKEEQHPMHYVKTSIHLDAPKTAPQVQTILNELTTKLVEVLGADLPLHQAFLAGGCLRDLAQGEEPKDYDLFFFSKEDTEKVNTYFTSIENNNSFPAPISSVTKSSLSNWNVDFSFKGKVYHFQFITIVYGQPENLVKTFDFTVNANYYNIATEEIVINPATWNKVLVPCEKILRPLNAIVRITKFIPRGYTIGPKDMISLVEQSTGKKFTEVEVQEQLCHLISG